VPCRHAAVLHLDGIERRRLDTNAPESTTATRVTEQLLTRGLPSPLKISHSRLNELRADDLGARGYQLLTQSREAGVDISPRNSAAISCFSGPSRI